MIAGALGLLKFRSLIFPLREIFIYQNTCSSLDALNQVHICQVSPQLSCGDTCQIWACYLIVVLTVLEIWENNGTEETGWVTPTPGPPLVQHYWIRYTECLKQWFCIQYYQKLAYLQGCCYILQNLHFIYTCAQWTELETITLSVISSGNICFQSHHWFR